MPGVAVMKRGIVRTTQHKDTGGIEATFTGVQQTIVLAIHDNF